MREEGVVILIKSKTFWAGVILIILGLVSLAEGKIDEASQLIFTGLGFIGLRDAIRKLEENL